MTALWNNDTELDLPGPKSLREWLRAARRGLPMLGFLSLGVLVFMLVRLIERPIFGMHRPWTPYITRLVCRAELMFLGLKVRQTGTPMKQPGAVVANHCSWLDIFVLNSRDLIYFVSKAEVSGWPGIGLLANITGTVFIERARQKAKEQTALFQDRLLAGHRLMFFPEGTSTDNQRVLPFKSTLFAAFMVPELAEKLHIQAVSVNYVPPEGGAARHYGWWGDMDFGGNLMGHLAAPRQGYVELTYHDPVRVSDFSNRKALAAALETQTRSAMPPSKQGAS